MPGEDQALACIANALRFVRDGWAEKALALGWSELELVGAHPASPWSRFDLMGAAIARDGVAYREGGPRGPLRRWRGAQKDGAAVPWETVEFLDAQTRAPVRHGD